MEDHVLKIDEIVQKGITVTTVVANGYIETSVRQSGGDIVHEPHGNSTAIALLEFPLSAGDPRLQHARAIRHVHAGLYGDFSV